DRRGSAFRASFSTSMLCDLQYMRKKYVDPNNKEAGTLMGTRAQFSCLDSIRYLSHASPPNH
ncbi:MAG: hypothetical protein OXF08_09600, partial [Bacteroidetes bacterium]|nr:hypothetical protein [Bacteroidota bacterium]